LVHIFPQAAPPFPFADGAFQAYYLLQALEDYKHQKTDVLYPTPFPGKLNCPAKSPQRDYFSEESCPD
jgi:hypothetical protein